MLNHCMRSGILFLIWCLPVVCLFGQIQIMVDLPSQSSKFNYTDLWDFQCNNSGNQPLTARLRIQISEVTKGEILQIETDINIPVGVKNFRYNFYFNFSSGISKENFHPDFYLIFSNGEPFPEGEYSISYEILKNPEKEDQLSANQSLIISYTNSGEQEQTKQINSKTKTNNRVGMYAFIPGDTLKAYLQVDARIGFDLGDIPFYFDGLFSTNKIDQEQINSIGFHFDANNYKDRLRKKVANDIGEFEGKKQNKVASLSKLKNYVDKDLFAAFIDDKMADINEMNLSLREDKKQDVERWKEKYKKLKLKKEILENELDLKDRNFEINNTEGLADALGAFGFFKSNEASKFWTYTERFSLGHSYPFYSPLTISGVRILGIDWAYNNKAKYIAISAGQLQNKKFLPFVNTYDENPDILASRHNRNIVASQLGIGFRDNNHLFITGMYVYDVEGSMDTDLSDIAVDPLDFAIKPKSNLIFASELKLELLSENRLYIEGEASSSTVRRNRQLPNVEDTNGDAFEDIPFWSKWFGVDRETSHDLAYRGSLVFKPLRNTKFRVGYNHIGSGYESFAVPFLRNDLKRWEFRGEQGILKNRINFTAFYRRDQYNLLDSLKNDIPYFRIFGGQVQLKQIGLSYMSFGYRHSKQSGDNDDFASSFRTSLAHRYKTGDVRHSTAFTFGFFESRDNENSGAVLYNIQQQIKLPSQLEFFGQFYFNKRNGQKNNQSDFSLGYLFNKIWRNRLGWRRYNNDFNIRNDYYFESSVNFNQKLKASLFLERDDYKQQQEQEQKNYPYAIRFVANYVW